MVHSALPLPSSLCDTCICLIRVHAPGGAAFRDSLATAGNSLLMAETAEAAKPRTTNQAALNRARRSSSFRTSNAQNIDDVSQLLTMGKGQASTTEAPMGLQTPRKSFQTLDSNLLTPTARSPTDTASMTSSVDSPSSLSTGDGITASKLYSVKISVPSEMPTTDPTRLVAPVVLFDVVVRHNLTGREWTVARRYSAFDELKNKLWWARSGGREVDDSLMPPKQPNPGLDVEKLRTRAAGLEEWASAVLEQPAALREPCAIAFFRLERPKKSSASLEAEIEEAELAIVRLQAITRGVRARRQSCELKNVSSSTLRPRALAAFACAAFAVLLLLLARAVYMQPALAQGEPLPLPVASVAPKNALQLVGAQARRVVPVVAQHAARAWGVVAATKKAPRKIKAHLDKVRAALASRGRRHVVA